MRARSNHNGKRAKRAYELSNMAMHSGVFVRACGLSSACLSLLTQKVACGALQQQPYANGEARGIGSGFLGNVRYRHGLDPEQGSCGWGRIGDCSPPIYATGHDCVRRRKGLWACAQVHRHEACMIQTCTRADNKTRCMTDIHSIPHHCPDNIYSTTILISVQEPCY